VHAGTGCSQQPGRYSLKLPDEPKTATRTLAHIRPSCGLPTVVIPEIPLPSRLRRRFPQNSAPGKMTPTCLLTATQPAEKSGAVDSALARNGHILLAPVLSCA